MLTNKNTFQEEDISNLQNIIKKLPLCILLLFYRITILLRHGIIYSIHEYDYFGVLAITAILDILTNVIIT